MYKFQFDLQRFAVTAVKISGTVNGVEVGDTFTVGGAKYTVLSVESNSVTASVDNTNPTTNFGKKITIDADNTKTIGDGNTDLTATKLFTINGLDDVTGSTIDETNKVVTLDREILEGRTSDTVTVDNYTFNLGGNADSGISEPPGTTQTVSGNTTIDKDGVYKITGSGTYTITATNVKIIGNGSQLSNVSINASGVEGINLWIQNLNIQNSSDINTIKFGSGDNYLTVKGTNTLKNTNQYFWSAVINSGTGTLNIIGDGNLTAELTGSSSNGAAIGGSYTDGNVSNINISGSVNITAKSVADGAGIGSAFRGSCGNINIGGNATVNATSTANGAGIGSGYSGSCGNITIGGNATVNANANYGAGIGSGYSGSCGNIIIAGNASVTASSSDGQDVGAGFSGGSAGTVTYGKDATINGKKGTADIADPTSGISNPVEPTNSSGDSGDDISKPTEYKELGWHNLDTSKPDNFYYTENAKSDYYSLSGDSKTVTYQTFDAGDVKILLSGISGTLENPEVLEVSLNADNFAGNVSVISNVGYIFELSAGNYNGKSFTGLSTASDYITNYGSSIAIFGLSGDDNISSSRNSNVTIDGGNGNDKITNSGSNVTITGGEGSDTILNFGNSAIIDGGNGNDTISNQGTNVTLNGGLGDDTIGNFNGSNISINAGEGSNLIKLFAGDNITVNVGSGSDIITIDKTLFKGTFTVEEFGKDDTIKVASGQSIIGISGGIKVGNATILGLSAVTENYSWNTSASSITYEMTSTSGVKFIDDTTIVQKDAITDLTAVFTINGLSQTIAADNIDNDNKVVTLDREILEGRSSDTVTVDNYTFSLGAGITEPTGDTQTISGNTTIDKDGVYQFDDDFTGTVTINAKNVKLIGATSQLSNVSIDASSVEGMNLWIEDLNIQNSNDINTIKFGSGDNYLTVKGTNTLKNTNQYSDSAVINSGTGTLNIIGDGNLTAELTGSSSNGAAIGSSYSDGNVSNINISGSVNITAKATSSGAGIGSAYMGSCGNINIGGNATVNATSTANGAGIGSGYRGSCGNITIGGNATVTATGNNGAGIGSGFADSSCGNIIIAGNAGVTASSTKGKPVGAGFANFTEVNVTRGKDATINGTKGTADIADIADPTSGISNPVEPTNSSGDSGDDISKPTEYKELGWHNLDTSKPDNFYYTENAKSDYYSLSGDSKTVTYQTFDYGDVQILLSGISSADGFNVADGVVTLNAANFGSSVAIVSNSGYAFNLTGTAPNMPTTFTGMSTADTITNAVAGLIIDTGLGDDLITNSGLSVTINAGDGNDTINNTGNNALIDGGNGDDNITNSGASSTIIGGDGKDTINNTANNTSIDAGNGDDNITNSGTSSTIIGGDGNDTINNTANNTSIDGGNGDDNITNSGASSTIIGGDGKDTINNTGDNVTIDSGDGNDSIGNVGGNVLINSGAGNDTITNEGLNNVTINSGAGNDNINNTVNDVWINAGDGDDSINNTADYVTINGGDGADTITNTGALTTINGGDGNDNITNSGTSSTINSGDGNDTINNTANNTSIDGGNGDDNITNSGLSSTIIGGDGNDTINNTANNTSIDGGLGDDFITNSGASSTIIGGEGNDTITNSGDNVTIDGGAGNDTITNSGDNVTIDGGAGDDLIDFNGTNGVIKFTDGNDTINYSADYVIDFDGVEGYDVTADGSDLIISNGTNAIRITNGLGQPVKALNYNGEAEATITSPRDIGKMLTYNAPKKTQVTLNGSAQANGKTKLLFEGILQFNDTKKDYNAAAVTITAAEGANNDKGIYIQGNAKNNIINILSGGDNKIDGGAGNDRINLKADTGKDVIIFGAGNDTVTNFESQDKVQFTGYNADTFKRDVNSNGDVIFTLSSGNTLNLKDVATTDDDGITITIVDSKAQEIDGISGYTYTKNTIRNDKGNVELTGGATAYTVTANDKSLDVSKAKGAVTIDVDETADNTVTVTGFAANDKLNVSIADIKTSSYSDNAITLGIKNGGLNIANAPVNTVQLTEGVFTVGTNNLYQDNATTLTSDYTTNEWFKATGDSAIIFGGFVTNNIGLSGTSGNDFITTGLGDDSVFGGDGADTIVFSGGNDTIFDYKFGEDVINIGNLDFANGTYDSNSGFVTIKQGGNSSITIFIDSDNIARQITFTDGENTSVRSYGDIGNFNEEFTAVTLKSDVALTDDDKVGFDADKLAKDDDRYNNLSTIVADNVLDNLSYAPTIKGLSGLSSYITAGDKSLQLVGGDKDDTLISGSGNATMTGGSGADLFMPGTGNDVITDYSYADKDSINIEPFDINDITGLSKLGDDGITINFSNSSTLGLNGINGDSAVNINGASYYFSVIDDEQKITTGDKKAVTYLTEKDIKVSDLGSAVETVMANGGGTVTADDDGGTIGGKNVTLNGGNGKDNFIYAGGNVAINKFTVTDSQDAISLAEGITAIAQKTDNNGKVTITTSQGDLVVDIPSYGSTTFDITQGDGTPYTVYIQTNGNTYNNGNGNRAESSAVTIQPTEDEEILSDFSTLNDDKTEYYANLVSITSIQDNMAIVGNAKNNYIIVSSGKYNILTGGLGADQFAFKSGGGVIRDFGAGAIKKPDKTAKAGATTNETYNRKDPESYKQGTDGLTIYGKVLEIAYKSDDTTKTNSKVETFTAFVTYKADADGQNYTIKLDNIYKYATKSTTANNFTYRTDAVVAKSFNIWDTSKADEETGTLLTQLDLAGTDSNLLNEVTDYSSSNYATNITEITQFEQSDQYMAYCGTDSSGKFTGDFDTNRYNQNPYSGE